MRSHGTLTRWNDDRGFGFISPAGDKPELFVHISAFPRDGVRPRLNELISFEVEAGSDGRQRAVRVMRPGQRAAQSTGAKSVAQTAPRRAASAGLTLAILAGLAAWGYSAYERHSLASRGSSLYEPEVYEPEDDFRSPHSSRCDGRTMCSQMTSCEEAKWFIRNCPGTQMDGDNDGIPCESQWCK